MHRFRLAPLPLALVLAACVSVLPPLYEGLGVTQRPVSTRVELAQRYFDQGLALCWAFQHDAAEAAFREAARLDPDCAMAWWGVAYALGPNINLPLTDARRAARAHEAAQEARALAEHAAPVERALIDAMAQRFADPAPKDRQPLDDAYAAAMREVWRSFPDDIDVGVLFADALMNVSKRWREWPVDGDRGPHTPEIVATLERVLGLAPDHAGANHFWVHAVEASSTPERGLVAADRLRAAAPAAGHLLHMPAHIDIRVGRYADAIATNERAIAADDAFFARSPEQGVYHYYRAHNHHFLIWAAMFQGSRGRALEAARTMVAKLPKESLGDLPRSIEAFLFVPVHVMMRFGMWEEILAEPLPEERFPIARALAHHARAVAFATTGRLAEADAEQAAFDRVAAPIPPDQKVRSAKVGTLLSIARDTMRGEILYHRGEREAAFAALREAAATEDTLPYSEPPGWMQPVRHALGALLLADGRLEAAEAVYREDLARHAENGWSLHGLAESLRRAGRVEEASVVEERFRAAWAHADVAIEASCFCRPAG